tara:strand:- start:4244 stop:5431 length:1188 start_codon:yes stop_codon:yes gene_type:complete
MNFTRNINFGHVEIASKGLNWLYIPFLAIMIEPEILGEIILIQSIVAILSSAMLFGQNRVVLKFTSIDNSLAIYTSLIIITALSMLLITGSFLLRYDVEFIIFATYLITIHSIFCLTLRANEKLKNFLFLRLSHVIIRLFSGCFLVVLYKSPIFYIVGDVIGVLVSLIIYFFKNKNYIPGAKIIKKSLSDNIPKYALFGLPLFLQALLASLSTNIDRFILDQNGYSSDLGSYGIIVTISSSIVFILAYYAVLFEVVIYRSKNNEEANLVSSTFLKKSILTSVLVSPILFLTYYMIQVINPALGFYPLTFLLFVFSNILMAVYFKYSYICSFANKTSLILMASLVLAFLTVIFNFILIPTHGIDGASWSKLSALILTILILNFNFFNPFKIYINKK